MKIIQVFSLAIAMSLCLAGTTSRASDQTRNSSDPEEETTADTDDDADAEVTIKTVTLARDAGEKFETVTNFSTSDTYCALVELSAPKEGTRVKCVWTAIAAGEIKNKKIFEKDVTINPETTKDTTDPSRVDFSLSHDNPYPVGAYKAEVYLNGKLAQTLKFKIQ